MCSHATEEQARACECTGYGFGDLKCRCGRKRSEHEGNTGRCLDAAARCHEFVLAFPEDPRPVTEQDIQVAALALEALLSQCPASTVDDLARTALLAATGSQYAREWEVASLRKTVAQYRDQLAFMNHHLERLGMTLDDGAFQQAV
jgi:hypothetical protein